MKREIIPAILAKDFADFKKKLVAVRALRPPMIQIDVADGTLTPWRAFGDAKKIQKLSLPPYEVDLMVGNPEKAALEWILAGAKRIIFHIEPLRNPEVVIDLVRLYNRKVGIALSPGTSLKAIEPYVSLVDLIQFKGVEPGKSGQKFIPAVLKKIKALHQRYPKLPIAVDGGVNLTTIGSLIRSGASIFGMTSAIMGADDPMDAYKKFKRIVCA